MEMKNIAVGLPEPVFVENESTFSAVFYFDAVQDQGTSNYY